MAGSFKEILFPEDISYGSSGGPKFKTTIFTADSGYEQRNRDWSQVRCEYDVSQAIKTRTQMDKLMSFFYTCEGKAYGFRFKDWADFTLSNQLIGVGDGVTKDFQIVKTYKLAQTESGENYSYTRKLTKIKWDSLENVKVGVSIVTSPGQYECDHSTGIIHFFVAPPMGAQVVIGSGEFHIPVRFDIDQMDITQEFWETETWPNIPLVEVRDWKENFQ